MKKNYLSTMAETIEQYTWEFGSGKEIRFNSNTLPNAPQSLSAFLKDMQKDCPINEYADPNYTNLKKLLASYENVGKENLTITNSGDEAIDIIAKTFLNPNDFFVVTPPTYEMFSIQCKINRGKPIEVPLYKDTWGINVEEIINASKKPKTKIIFLCNPNNPTASIIDSKIIEKVVKESDAIVVVDETYREFYGKSSVDLLKKYNNLVILRSFSKFAGIAGARIGYLIAGKEISQKFDCIRFPMGVSFFSYKLAEYVLKNDQKWIKERMEEIKKERKKLAQKLIEFGFFVYPSYANFLLVKIGDRAKEIYQKLKENNIYIRDRSSKKNLENCARITVRSEKENLLLITELKRIIKSEKNKYAFIDRDGTLIFEPQDTYQIDSVEKLKILNGVVKGLKFLLKNGYQLVLVSNQDGLGTSSFPTADFEKVQNLFLEKLKKDNIVFKKVLICPHFPKDLCMCRKPKLGLIEDSLTKDIDCNNSFVLGDRLTDKLFAKNLGINFIPMKTNGNFYNALQAGGII